MADKAAAVQVWKLYEGKPSEPMPVMGQAGVVTLVKPYCAGLAIWSLNAV